MSKNKYYSLKGIKKYNALYNVIFGERGNGKTTSVLREGLEQYFKNGSEMAIIRRWELDFTGKRGPQMWDHDIIRDDLKKYSDEWTDIYYKSSRWYLMKYDEEGNRVVADNPFCYAFALNGMGHDKSISFPRIRTILFDEFIESNGRYLVDEFTIFTNMLSTIIRDKEDVVIYMCANTVSKFCPYWRELGINVDKQKQGTIDVYTYGESELTLACEYCKSTDPLIKKSNKYFAFDNPKLKMITSGAWQLDIYPHLFEKYRPAEVRKVFYIMFNDHFFQGNIIKKDDGNKFIYIHEKTSEIKEPETDIVFCLEPSHRRNWFTRITNPENKLTKIIYDMFKNRRVCYQDNTVGDQINGYLMQCIKK